MTIELKQTGRILKLYFQGRLKPTIQIKKIQSDQADNLEELPRLISNAVAAVEIKDQEILRRFYGNEETAEAAAESVGLTTRQFYNRKKKALEDVASMICIEKIKL